MNKITPNLMVDSIESCLEFWIGRLGFEQVTEVMEGERLGFVILKRGAVQLMLQSRASMKKDVEPLAAAQYLSMLYCEVSDLAPLRKALQGWPEVVPERTTFYGTRELIVKDPVGNVICFSQHV
ncbi:MAG: hypothetical protein RL685_1511 [Pseudomonadota bacterium]|jgi:uncharacterized glyoxalase superfamily protein PhnB